MKIKANARRSPLSPRSPLKAANGYRNAVLACVFIVANAWAASAIAAAVQPASFDDSTLPPGAAWPADASFSSCSQYEPRWSADAIAPAGPSDETLAAKALSAPTAPPPQAEKIALGLIAFAACALWYGLGKNKQNSAAASPVEDVAYDSHMMWKQGIPFLPEIVYDQTREFEHAKIVSNEDF